MRCLLPCYWNQPSVKSTTGFNCMQKTKWKHSSNFETWVFWLSAFSARQSHGGAGRFLHTTLSEMCNFLSQWVLTHAKWEGHPRCLDVLFPCGLVKGQELKWCLLQHSCVGCFTVQSRWSPGGKAPPSPLKKFSSTPRLCSKVPPWHLITSMGSPSLLRSCLRSSFLLGTSYRIGNYKKFPS